MKTILKVDFNDEDGRYYIAAGNGSSTSECAFACAVVARVFEKQGFISDDEVEDVEETDTDEEDASDADTE